MRDLTGLQLGHQIGAKHHLWKGNAASYSAIHYWLYRQVGKAKKCSDCGSTKRVEWANISGQYKRAITDYKELCRKCHAAFDGYVNKAWATRKAVSV